MHTAPAPAHVLAQDTPLRQAALLERAYRMALLLQGACDRLADDGAALEPRVLAAELVTLLDDARATLTHPAPHAR